MAGNAGPEALLWAARKERARRWAAVYKADAGEGQLEHVVIVDPLHDIIDPCQHLSNAGILALRPIGKRGPLTVGEGGDPLSK
jgi:hypothetical protein